MVYRIYPHEDARIPATAPAGTRGSGGQGGGAEHNPGNFANDPQKASEAGRKGGQHSGGNFARDPQRAAEAGHKGGQHSSGNFAQDPQRAAEAGRKGGQHSHDHDTDKG